MKVKLCIPISALIRKKPIQIKEWINDLIMNDLLPSY